MFDQITRLKQGIPDRSDADLDEYLSVYNAALEANRMYDSADVIEQPIDLLTKYLNEAQSFRRNYVQHLLVDEFQDVTPRQYELIKLLLEDNGKGLFAIGDPDQAIYGSRGSNPKYFDEIHMDFPRLKRVALTKNYRSHATIVKFAAECLMNAENQVLIAVLKGGTKARVVPISDPKQESKFVINTIEKLIGGTSSNAMESPSLGFNESNRSFKDIAVIYRLNAVGDQMEDALVHAGIPYQRVSKNNPKEESELIKMDIDAVTLLTAHASKGLEFQVVFIIGCEDTVFPFVHNDHDTDICEERKLFYVAVTRAKKDLFLSFCKSRKLFGNTVENGASRFLDGRNPKLTSFIKPKFISRKNQSAQIDLFTS